MPAVRLLSLSLLAALAACSGRSGPVAPPAVTLGLRATPESFAPGTTVTLVPQFASGTGEISGIGPVQSGRAYVVGPVEQGQRYTLTVVDGGDTQVRTLDVPLRFRERTTALPPSPLARSSHAALRLADGRVLVVGGSSPGNQFWATAERYDPATGQFEPVGDLSIGRRGPRLVALPGGAVLSFGGESTTSSFVVATRVEAWDPALRAWSVVGNLTCNRSRHTATRLADGRVLVAGGAAFGGTLDDRRGEIWGPGTGARRPAGSLVHWRVAHTATELADGRILLAGGFDPTTGEVVREAELFDPATETSTPTGLLAAGRFEHAAVRLPDGRVLVLGGEQFGGALASAEIYDPATGLFTGAAPLAQAVTEVRAVRLGSGEVLVAGGQLGAHGASALLQAYAPATGQWRAFGNGLPAARSGHSLTVLADAAVLLLGGDPGTGFPVAIALRLD